MKSKNCITLLVFCPGKCCYRTCRQGYNNCMFCVNCALQNRRQLWHVHLQANYVTTCGPFLLFLLFFFPLSLYISLVFFFFYLFTFSFPRLFLFISSISYSSFSVLFTYLSVSIIFLPTLFAHFLSFLLLLSLHIFISIFISFYFLFSYSSFSFLFTCLSLLFLLLFSSATLILLPTLPRFNLPLPNQPFS